MGNSRETWVAAVAGGLFVGVLLFTMTGSGRRSPTPKDRLFNGPEDDDVYHRGTRNRGNVADESLETITSSDQAVQVSSHDQNNTKKQGQTKLFLRPAEKDSTSDAEKRKILADQASAVVAPIVDNTASDAIKDAVVVKAKDATQQLKNREEEDKEKCLRQPDGFVGVAYLAPNPDGTMIPVDLSKNPTGGIAYCQCSPIYKQNTATGPGVVTVNFGWWPIQKGHTLYPATCNDKQTKCSCNGEAIASSKPNPGWDN